MSSIGYIVLISAIVYGYLELTPAVIQPVVTYSSALPAVPFNNLAQNAKKLFYGEVKAPEAFAQECRDGELLILIIYIYIYVTYISTLIHSNHP